MKTLIYTIALSCVIAILAMPHAQAQGSNPFVGVWKGHVNKVKVKIKGQDETTYDDGAYLGIPDNIDFKIRFNTNRTYAIELDDADKMFALNLFKNHHKLKFTDYEYIKKSPSQYRLMLYSYRTNIEAIALLNVDHLTATLSGNTMTLRIYSDKGKVYTIQLYRVA